MTDTAWLGTACPRPSETHRNAAEARQNTLTKPPGSLGALERIAIQLAALQETERPCADNVQIVLFAGDHGVTAQGISAFPSAVTVEMLRNFASGGAAISVLARKLDARLEVVDAGTLATSEVAGVVTDKPCHGTRDFATTPAMTPDETAFAFDTGRRAVARTVDRGAHLLIFGEMGIGNTTSAAAVAAALLGKAANDLVGAGTGLDSDGIRHKARVIDAALDLHGLKAPDVPAADVLMKVGGLEIAALAGAIVAAAQSRIPVLVDGFIVTAAALAATRLNPSCADWLIYSHRSSEQGHRLILEALDAEPLLDLKMRLGEGSGAAVALSVVRLACALHGEMATFAEAHVSESL
ncbi:nicotinate-nucleotide--dimethylbenzimidazole phosphoribosyltransferase [Hyphomicrobium nitrativorans NL23]|uniref:Nicotinate-nucleotide--dimethylbenzimidazole phosphoribosyltransferase n=1 Tax=Hyphomicrobium nitrativorans NL23 TaxID=1029756 RepID=V5SD79_9HYPH|nr:nicotinate-nucleotide--dimethylbenzimidazole phosphoribosyltransferase [Hyphomicrobium nitrativorans]AHB48488.1 nicotinate-nucleotide--dimethylbenzimidazole phosphoribosyltransferase [Hyphomicrobium nitrativorans NL23]